ncbi:hypothetical protein HYW76_02595 [Candidatus Pacearchaeota archaeon]|nr:hypothetical protein [Candidatus Pacearchaeota archaeon]
MLFHLKEPDYEREAPKDITTRFYGRTSEQILTTLDYYAKRTEKEGNAENPNRVWWLKREFSVKDIEQVKTGEFYFFTGMIYVGEEVKDQKLFEKIRIGEDFNIGVPRENIGNFALWRMYILKEKRAELYKLQNPIPAFMNISFVPEDIAIAIINCDLTPYENAVREDLARRAELSKHPNVKVDILQEILKNQSKVPDIGNPSQN